jgi:hypothetical protein
MPGPLTFLQGILHLNRRLADVIQQIKDRRVQKCRATWAGLIAEIGPDSDHLLASRS